MIKSQHTEQNQQRLNLPKIKIIEWQFKRKCQRVIFKQNIKEVKTEEIMQKVYIDLKKLFKKELLETLIITM